MFYSDNPIEETKDDLLNRGIFANRIATAVSTYACPECLIIGVYGGWGDGKSSLANLIINQIKQSGVKDKYAVIRFNPWLYSNKEDLISQMFKEISHAFKISDPSETTNKVANVIEKAGKIIGIAKYLPIPIAPELSQTISDIFGDYSAALKDGASGEKELPEIKEEIESVLESNKIKLLIAIDDFDRLNQDEIRIMFQVIKILGNFKNTIYMLMMDKDVVVKSLEKVQGGSGEDYLKKIVQVPITLPTVSEIQLRNILNQEFMNVIGNEEYAEYHELFDNMITTCVIPYISNIRDIKRIVNLFEFKQSFVKRELNLVDLFILCCIELYDKATFHSLMVDKEKLLEKKADLRNSFTLPTRVLSTDEEDALNRKAEISRKCVSKLFFDDTSKIGKGNYRRIADRKYYDSFFSLSLPSNTISLSLIDSIIKYYSKEQINETIRNRQINTLELINEMERNLSYIPDDRITIMFSSIFNNFSYMISEQGISKATLHYLLNSLFDRMSYYSILKTFTDSHFDNSSSKEALIIIDFLLSQEHMHSRMLEQSCYGGCKVKIDKEQLKELESICKESLKSIKLFDYDLREFSMLFYVWRSLDHEESVLFIKHHFFPVENSEVKLIYSLTQKNNESLVINIREIEMYVDCTELFNRISHKTKMQLLSIEEKTVISAFKFYYNNKSDFSLDQNGCAEVYDYMIGGKV